MKITTLFNMQTTRWATIPLLLVLMLPHLHQTSAVGNLRGHSDPDIRHSRNRQSHDQVSYRNRDHSRPSASSMDQVSGFPDNDESPSSSPWDPPSTDFSGVNYQPDEDSPDRQWQDQVSGVPDNNQGPSSCTWNVQGTDVSGEYRQPDEITLAVSQLSLERADRGLIPASSSNTGATQLPGPLPWYQDPVLRDFGQFIGDLVDLLWQMLPPLEDNRQSTDALMGIRHMASLIVNQVGKYDPVEYGHTEEFQSISEEFERIGKQWGEDFSQNYGTCTTMIHLIEQMICQRIQFIRNSRDSVTTPTGVDRGLTPSPSSNTEEPELPEWYQSAARMV
ncbi:hypothetical protein SeLEV6574_g07737 [Synchytrium endobioticum]|uniref:Uncharacterized protein n=1 Tax=Synchytrium endobioticum TaxID=286115 RepID=A0A507CJZ5_9FUNG|nr:hypothetical protein SeLEV6574_g07737 [Synchytrium endobioticum]